MDSAVLLANYVHDEGAKNVKALSIDYGQRHQRELKYASKFAASLGVEHFTFRIPNLSVLLPGSSQTDENVPVPHGHYAEESMKQTVVPNRNMILLSIALGHAIALKAEKVGYAAHAGDHAIYPDCRPIFADALNIAAQFADWHICSIDRPFIKHTKADIANIGNSLKVDFRLTYSCYEGGEKHCGKCGTCVERREAFQIAEVPDPTEYATS